MDCCLTAPSHYLNRCWLLTDEFLWHLHGTNFTVNAQATILYNGFENLTFKLLQHLPGASALTHWGRVTHLSVSKQNTIGSDNGLSPGRRQAITWTNAGLLSIGPSGTNFSEIRVEIQGFSFTKVHLKMSSTKWRPFCPGKDELIRRVRCIPGQRVRIRAPYIIPLPGYLRTITLAYKLVSGVLVGVGHTIVIPDYKMSKAMHALLETFVICCTRRVQSTRALIFWSAFYAWDATIWRFYLDEYCAHGTDLVLQDHSSIKGHCSQGCTICIE